MYSIRENRAWTDVGTRLVKVRVRLCKVRVRLVKVRVRLQLCVQVYARIGVKADFHAKNSCDRKAYAIMLPMHALLPPGESIGHGWEQAEILKSPLSSGVV